jgi:type IV secretory pathway VirB10-like protein
MNPNYYPKPIRLKKTVLFLMVGFVSSIVILIFWNFIRISSETASTKPTPIIQLVASDTDMAFIQTMQTQKEKPPVNKNKMVPKEEPDSTVTETFLETHSEGKENLDKAMRASISSNQLLPETASITIPPQNLSLASDGPYKINDDSNFQMAKHAFLANAPAQSDYLSSSLHDPISPYLVQAGSIIPAVMITGINSDLPGQMIALVRSNVYDSISGKTLLIPQGAKLIGGYDSQVAFGQERVLVVWQRIIFPNGQSLNLQGMPGVDLSGYAGFHDQINNHHFKIFGSVVLMSVLGAGAQLAQPPQSTNPFVAPTVSQTLAQMLGTNLANTGTQIAAKSLGIQPTLMIRPGFLFNVMVTKDMEFPGCYEANR